MPLDYIAVLPPYSQKMAKLVRRTQKYARKYVEIREMAEKCQVH